MSSSTFYYYYNTSNEYISWTSFKIYQKLNDKNLIVYGFKNNNIIKPCLEFNDDKIARYLYENFLKTP